MANQQEQLAQLLVGAQSGDAASEQHLKEWEQRNFAEYIASVAALGGTEGAPELARQLAGLIIKNTLVAQDDNLQAEKHKRWTSLDAAVRDAVKQPLLAAMRSNFPGQSNNGVVQKSAAQAASEIAALELPYDQWPNFLPSILENIRSEEIIEHAKVASLQCLGYTCERAAGIFGPEISDQTTDSMLNAIVDGIQSSRPDSMRLAAATALKNSLNFASKNMEKKQERDAIMTTICEATRSENPEVRATAYECIVQIAVLYYDKLQDYMTTLYDLTTDTIRNDASEEVAKSAMEFWTSLCEVEQELIDEAQDLTDRNLPIERPCMRYVAAAFSHLFPFLTDTLVKQEEEADEDTYNLHMAGQICLTCISQTVEDVVVPVIMPFVQQNIQNENWRQRDAAIMAFTAMLDGPKEETIGPYVAQSIPVLLSMLADQEEMVRDTAAHCISRICLLHIRFVPNDQFPTLLQALTAKTGEGPKVASQACTALHNVANAFTEESQQQDAQQTNALSPFMQELMGALLKAYDRNDGDEANLRVSAMEAISVLISISAMDMTPMLTQLLPEIVKRFELTFNMGGFGVEDQMKKEQSQGLLCAVIQALYRKLDKGTVMPATDKIMELLLHVLQAKNAICHEECFSAISAVADVLEADFAKYMPALQPFLLQGLQNWQAYQVCIVAVGTVGDISRNIEAQIQPCCNDIMSALIETLKNNSVHRSVKPPVLSCFGDIAMAIGAAFEPYVQLSVMLLMQASTTTAPEDDEDLIEYCNLLRESILEAYVGVIQGLRDGNLLGLFVQYVQNIFDFLQRLADDPTRDDYVLGKAVGLVGDLAQSMGAQIKPQLNSPFIMKILQDAMATGDANMVQTATWASTMVSQACQGMPQIGM